MAAYLCWIAPRLLEMKRVLKPTGSIYVHCDDTAYAYLHLLMDAIFGRRALRNAIDWRRYGSHNDAKRYGRCHDTILFYAPQGATWNGLWFDLDPEYVKRSYRHEDETGRYRTAPLHATGLAGGGYEYDYRGFRRAWKCPRDRMTALEKNGRVRQGRGGFGIPERKIYLHESRGQPGPDWWDDIKPLTGRSKERTGWSTQKPVALYERIIRASTNERDLVLDPFCGCSTTLVAAERLGREWIGCDIDPKAEPVMQSRMEKLLKPDQQDHGYQDGRAITVQMSAPAPTEKTTQEVRSR